MIFKNILVFVYFNCVFSKDYETVVNTTSGTVKGLTTELLNKKIDQFLGIPYAVPPLGSLRFAKPKPITKPIEGIIDATKGKYSCIQKPGVIPAEYMSEDCLFLNIWSPKESKNNSTKLKPVMFWIYGGGLQTGSIFEYSYDGRVLATHEVVIVTVNYRLGTFGFLYGGVDSAPGNVGFYDQVLGLKWVRENIHLFGGDKNQITIFGESAGSWSVSAQVISPISNGLFQRAITQSGAHMYSKDRPVLSREEGLLLAKLIAKQVNCTDDKKWLECLRKVDAKLLLANALPLNYPVDRTEFLPVSAQKALKEPKDIDLMAGVTKNEGSTLANAILPLILSPNFNKKQFEDAVVFTDYIYHNINKDNVTQYYLDKIDNKDSTALRTAFYEFFGDISIKCPTYHFAKQFAKNTPKRNTYFYELTYQGAFVKTMGCDEKTMGICHGADIEFVFGLPIIYKQLNTGLSVEFSREVMKIWTNFAKTGKPDSNWPKLIDTKTHSSVTQIKELNPKNPNKYINDFKNCDGFWKNYY